MYRNIHTSLWTDQKIRKLPPNGKLLFVYLLTNPHTHVSGIYYLPHALIAYETGLTPPDLAESLDILTKADLVAFDEENEVVWVKNFFRYQPGGCKLREAAAKQLRGLHKSPLIEGFLNYYEHLNIPYRKGSDTVSKGYQSPIDGLTIPIPDPIPDLGKEGGVGGGKEGEPPERPPEPPPLPPKKQKTPKVPLPENFGISERVRAWAERKGYGQLEEHLEAFIRKATMNSYVYADWDAAFMEAVREDWAKIRKGQGGKGSMESRVSTINGFLRRHRE